MIPLFSKSVNTLMYDSSINLFQNTIWCMITYQLNIFFWINFNRFTCSTHEYLFT